jgi:hypothetical protein
MPKEVQARLRDATVQVRLTSKERALVAKLSKKSGESVSVTVRRLVREACTRERIR